MRFYRAHFFVGITRNDGSAIAPETVSRLVHSVRRGRQKPSEVVELRVEDDDLVLLLRFPVDQPGDEPRLGLAYDLPISSTVAGVRH